MPYYLKDDDRELLRKVLHAQVCAECGGRLEAFFDLSRDLPYLQCKANSRHEGIAKQYRESRELTTIARREQMKGRLGEEKTKALMRYAAVTALTRAEAKEILSTIWPKAPELEMTRAVMLCASYGLNPLMNHVFLVPFKRRDKEGKVIGEDWATIIGIKAKRLLAARKKPFSYIDNTPRVMTEDEQKSVFGSADPSKLWVITKLQDPKTGATSVGYGFWPKSEKPYGTEKGNTPFNMASIRSESQALDRLCPGEMPTGVGVIDESFIESASAIEGQYSIMEETPADEELPEGAPEANPSPTKKDVPSPSKGEVVIRKPETKSLPPSRRMAM